MKKPREITLSRREQKEWIPRKNARAETEAYMKLLQDNGISVAAVDDTPQPYTPDSVFPNNWFSTHADGTLVLYPMFAQNRRYERKPDALNCIRNHFHPKRTLDLTHFEKDGLFLEGTGSMVLDRENRIVYACRSPRTSEHILADFCNELGYTSVVFDAADRNGKPIYHTNVLMCVGSRFAVLCSDAIQNAEQFETVMSSLKKTGKTVVEISFRQMEHFAGNMLEVQNQESRHFLVMSKTARESLNAGQTSLLESFCTILSPDISCIETNGGGSARCMLAEIF